MLNDMMLPDRVTKVAPTATQPMNETVVNSERTLVVEKNPGVDAANAINAAKPTHLIR
jgi:hypothetical protein